MEEMQQVPYNLNKKKKNRGPDNMFLGLAAGILFPVIGILIMYFFWGRGDFGNYISGFFDFKNGFRMESAAKVLSIALIANLLPFYYFLNRKKYLTTRGIILAMFLFAIVIMLYKFVLK